MQNRKRTYQQRMTLRQRNNAWAGLLIALVILMVGSLAMIFSGGCAAVGADATIGQMQQEVAGIKNEHASLNVKVGKLTVGGDGDSIGLWLAIIALAGVPAYILAHRSRAMLHLIDCTLKGKKRDKPEITSSADTRGADYHGFG